MKTSYFFVLMALICLMLWVWPEKVKSQLLTDSTVNYYSLSAYYDNYYDSLIQLRGTENMQGTGYKDYLRWKWFYSYRHGVDGDFSGIWQGMTEYQDYYGEERSEEGFSWNFIGPLGIPPCRDFQCNTTGKGMMLSLWVDPHYNHELIYGGSHHSGLWKTIDGGSSWTPMTENNPEIIGVNSIAVDPGNYNNIYITSNSSFGEQYSKYYAGVFKSPDGGSTWTNISPSGEGYPTTDQSKSVRKIIIDKKYPDYVYFITRNKVFRSNDQGLYWDQVLDQSYNWDQNGLFDFKITPWEGDDIAYLAGSEIYKVTDPTGDFSSENISDQIFLAGINSPSEYIVGRPSRCEISMNANMPGDTWFCYSANYKRDDSVNVHKYIRIVKFPENEEPECLFEKVDEWGTVQIDGNKLEFMVSPSDYDVFFVGGVKMYQIIDNQNPEKDVWFQMTSEEYPELCWLHDDIRDMQWVYTNGTELTIYTANDAGISAGMLEDGCNQNLDLWHWQQLFESKVNGLDVTEFYGIGLFENEPSLIAGGCQDVSGMLFYNNQWYNFYDGDGTELVWDIDDRNIFYYNEMGSGKLKRTNDLGQTDVNIYLLNENNLIIPMELDPFEGDQVTTLYSGDKNLYEFIGVNNFSNTYSNLDPLEEFENPITDIEAGATNLPGNQTRFYVSTNKEYDGGGPYPGCLYRDMKEGLGFENISSNLPGCKNGFVSDIEVDPQSFYSLWVSFAGYSVGTQNEKIYYSSDKGTTWEDFSQGLPPGMPVYKIKYVEMNEEETFLLAATDVGVFKSGTEDADWHPINNNLPKSIVTDIEVNPKFNVIYASTYGRGLWKSPLFCNYTGESYDVTGHEIWMDNKTMDRDIIIEKNGILEINDCVVYLPAEAKIIVEPGGRLELHGSTLTSACDDLWWGVELRGNASLPQTEQYQGKIIMDEYATIEKARKAIFCGKYIEHNYPDFTRTGGIISATDAFFINNRYGVQIWTYQDRKNSYNSIFRKCSFITTEILADNSDPEFFMTLVQVQGVKIEGCIFENSIVDGIPFVENPGSGIYSLDANYVVMNMPNPCIFTNLEYGIFATKFRDDREIKIHNSIFTNNVTGVYASGIIGLEAYSNLFILSRYANSPNNICGGIFLNTCTGYTITDNTFNGTGTYVPDQIGITINNSGEAYNVIQDNIFNNLYIGTLAQNNNRSEDWRYGLKILCNTYISNKYDISVTGNGCVNCGIALYQGTINNPAGNLFSRMDSPDFENYHNELSPIIYFHHFVRNFLVPPLWYPINPIPNPLISKENTDIPWQEGYCNGRILETGDKTFGKDYYLSSSEVSDSLIATLSGLVDGGNTDALESEITFAQPDEAIDLQEELLVSSPFLSDTILIKSAEKEDVLAPVMIKEIMVANPQSAKSEKVMKALENRENPLPEYMMQEILEGRDTLAQKEILEAEISEAEFQKEIALNRLISIFREDTISTRLDSIINLLQNHNTLTASYQMVLTCLEKNDTVSALNMLDSIPEQFDLTSNQVITHERWIEWVDIMMDLNADSLNLVDSDTNMIERMTVLAQFNDQPGCLAKNSLHFLGILETKPYYILPGEQLKLVENKSNSQIGSTSFLKPYIRLYPNPAKNYLVIEYNVTNILDEGLLNIYTVNGTMQFTKQLKGNQHDLIINTKDWLDGIYFFNFTSSSEYKQSGKVIIAK